MISVVGEFGYRGFQDDWFLVSQGDKYTDMTACRL